MATENLCPPLSKETITIKQTSRREKRIFHLVLENGEFPGIVDTEDLNFAFERQLPIISEQEIVDQITSLTIHNEKDLTIKPPHITILDER